MSRAKAKRERPSYNPQTPEPGSKGWIRIIARGCGGSRDYFGEFDCSHYSWGCEQCPVCIEAEEQRERAWREAVMSMAGPPRPPSPEEQGILWWIEPPTVATELVRFEELNEQGIEI